MITKQFVEGFGVIACDFHGDSHAGGACFGVECTHDVAAKPVL